MEKVNGDSGLRHNTFTYLTEAIHKFKLVVSTVVFPMGRDSASFGDKGTEVPSLSRDKGTTGKAQNLATGQLNSWTERAGTAKIRDAGQNGTQQKRKF